MITTRYTQSGRIKSCHQDQCTGQLSVPATKKGADGHTGERHCEKDQVDQIRRVFRSKGVVARHVETTEATRTRTYYFTLAEDRLSDITKIDDTLGRILESALETSGVSILAPVPDTALIAVTVPRKTDTPVPLAPFIEAIEAGDFKAPFVLGEDFTGTPRIIDLASCQHQLVGGATGSGKSNQLKAIVTSIALTCSPKRVRMILIDGKGMDLTAFNGLPHLICPVINDRETAYCQFEWLIQGMERRGLLLQNSGVSDIWAYNDRGGSAEDLSRALATLPQGL